MITILGSVDHFATLAEAEDGVVVTVYRSTGRYCGREGGASPSRLIYTMTIDAPFHIALDRVHDALNKGEAK